MLSGITSFTITHRNPCLRHPRLYFASPNALGEARERSERVGVPYSLSATTTTTTTNAPLGGSLSFFPPHFTAAAAKQRGAPPAPTNDEA